MARLIMDEGEHAYYNVVFDVTPERCVETCCFRTEFRMSSRLKASAIMVRAVSQPAVGYALHTVWCLPTCSLVACESSIMLAT